LESSFDRFSALVRRELGGSDVRLLDPAETPPFAPNVAHDRLPDGRTVLVTFENAPEDIDALRRRLSILVSTFAESLSDPAGDKFRAARPPVSTSLFDELKALAARAQAIDVVVIDADSPILWGSARKGVLPTRTAVPLADVSAPRLVSDDASAPELVDASAAAAGPNGHAAVANVEDEGDEGAVQYALTAVRALAGFAGGGNVHKGRPLRHTEVDVDKRTGYLVLSFSGIYLLVLVYRGTFDELRAERAAHEALPRIERLVLALPPLDPEPQPAGQVVALRRRR
jgi:hypothetical protein